MNDSVSTVRLLFLTTTQGATLNWSEQTFYIDVADAILRLHKVCNDFLVYKHLLRAELLHRNLWLAMHTEINKIIWSH